MTGILLSKVLSLMLSSTFSRPLKRLAIPVLYMPYVVLGRLISSISETWLSGLVSSYVSTRPFVSTNGTGSGWSSNFWDWVRRLKVSNLRSFKLTVLLSTDCMLPFSMLWKICFCAFCCLVYYTLNYLKAFLNLASVVLSCFPYRGRLSLTFGWLVVSSPPAMFCGEWPAVRLRSWDLFMEFMNASRSAFLSYSFLIFL